MSNNDTNPLPDVEDDEVIAAYALLTNPHAAPVIHQALTELEERAAAKVAGTHCEHCDGTGIASEASRD